MLNNILRIGTGFLSMTVLCAVCNAQDAETSAVAENQEAVIEVSPYQPSIMQDGRIITIADYTIENPTAASKRGQSFINSRNKHMLWRSFMHGVTDGAAMPVAWQACDPEGTFKALLDDKAVIDTKLKKSNLPAIRLEAKQTASFPVPVFSPEQLYASRGDIIRFFFWLKAEGTGQKTDLWSGAPKVILHIRDTDGMLLDTAESISKTRGSFPWFCYYMDVKIPTSITKPADKAPEKKADEENKDENAAADNPANEDAAQDDAGLDAFAKTLAEIDDNQDSAAAPKSGGIYVTVSNPDTGIAWFSTFSWQKITPQNSIYNYNFKNRRLDTQTGSLAPNPDYDELPMHLFFGLSQADQWTFLHGTNKLDDLTKKDNLVKYINTYKDDWGHLVHAIPYLAYLHNNGILLKTMPDFEEGWDEALAAELLKIQDPVTGLWKAGNVPNIFASYLIAANCFAPETLARGDRKPFATPWLSVKGGKLQNADSIIASILSVQTTAANMNKAAWNNFAFQPEELNAEGQNSLCDLAATSAAANLLARAAANASDLRREQAEKAVKEAWTFVMNNLVFKNGLWKKSSLDNGHSSPAYLFSFLNATPWLEMRQGKDMVPAQVKSTLSETGAFTLEWQQESPYVSLRVFVSDTALKTSQLTESNLMAIVQPNSNHILNMDPLIALRNIVAAGKKYMDVTPETENAAYIASKLAAIPPKVRIFSKTNGVKFTIPPAKKNMSVHIAAVNSYGEMSPWITLPEIITGTAPDEDAEEAAEQE